MYSIDHLELLSKWKHVYSAKLQFIVTEIHAVLLLEEHLKVSNEELK